jgi:hypothetical protein
MFECVNKPSNHFAVDLARGTDVPSRPVDVAEPWAAPAIGDRKFQQAVSIHTRNVVLDI